MNFRTELMDRIEAIVDLFFTSAAKKEEEQKPEGRSKKTITRRRQVRAVRSRSRVTKHRRGLTRGMVFEHRSGDRQVVVAYHGHRDWRYLGKKYSSPSGAAFAAAQDLNLRGMKGINGWIFWNIDRKKRVRVLPERQAIHEIVTQQQPELMEDAN